MPDGTGLYVHVPFCRIKCHYCDFACYPGLEDRIDAYIEALGREWTCYPDDMRIASLYLGGGTPSLLGPEQVRRLVTLLRSRGDWSGLGEATFEVNPGTGGPDLWQSLREAGFRRISMGVQVMDDARLRAIGRDHGVADVHRTLAELRAAGLQDVSMDLIYGLPGQEPESWAETLEQVVALAPPHLSLYALQVEERTLFGVRAAQGRLDVPDEDRVRIMHDHAVERLAAAGLRRYEIASWCTPGHESVHNRIYWMHRPFVGLGVGAHSWDGTRRYGHDRSFRGYMADPSPRRNVEPEAPALSYDTALIMGLRLVEEGVDIPSFTERFGEDPFEVHGAVLEGFLAEGLLERRGTRLRLAPDAIPVANGVFAALLRDA